MKNSNPLEKVYLSSFHPPSVLVHRPFEKFAPVYGAPLQNSSASENLYNKQNLSINFDFRIEECLLGMKSFLYYIVEEKIHPKIIN
jgi:hypothetical protein